MTVEPLHAPFELGHAGVEPAEGSTPAGMPGMTRTALQRNDFPMRQQGHRGGFYAAATQLQRKRTRALRTSSRFTG